MVARHSGTLLVRTDVPRSPAPCLGAPGQLIADGAEARPDHPISGRKGRPMCVLLSQPYCLLLGLKLHQSTELNSIVGQANWRRLSGSGCVVRRVNRSGFAGGSNS